MEFTFTAGALIFWGLAVAVALADILRAIGIAYRTPPDVEAIGTQIHKLIVANNLDRAIKLCNSVEADVPGARGARQIIIVAARRGADAVEAITAAAQSKLLADLGPPPRFPWFSVVDRALLLAMVVMSDASVARLIAVAVLIVFASALTSWDYAVRRSIHNQGHRQMTLILNVKSWLITYGVVRD